MAAPERETRWHRIAELLLEQGLFGVGLIDPDLRIVRVNDAVAAITGYSREELLGVPVAELIDPEDRDEAVHAIRRLVDGDLPSYSAELRGRTRDGRRIWGRLAIWPLRDDRGRIDACLGVLEDVTGARRERERSRRTERRIREAMVAMTDARDPKLVLQAVVDLAREVLDAQYAALGVLPEGGEELTEFLVSGIGADAIEEIGRRPSGRGLLGAVTRSGGPIRLEDLHRHPDSRGFPPHHPEMRSFLGVPIAYKGQVLGNLYLTNKLGGQDFTSEDEATLLAFAAQAAVVIENARLHESEQELIRRLERTNEELAHASQVKSVFLASMSHELRTPLHALLLAADILRDPSFPVTETRARELSETIATSGRHLLGLIDDLLVLSRIEAGRFEVRLQPTALDLVLRESELAVSSLAEGKGIELDVGSGTGIWVEADPLRARQAVINLLANAVKFTERGGRVWTEARVEDDVVTIAVCDTGSGIAPQDLERIFMPFEQAAQVPGAGLGLAISRSIARAHGGDLEVSSEPGRGSRFELTLRRSRRTVVVSVPDQELRVAPADRTVLVVEDDADTRGLTMEVLRSAGYEVIGASSVGEALVGLDARAPDLVLVDVRLGEGDGLELVRRVRRDPILHDLPVIACSASTSAADVARAMQAGCTAFLAKPLTPRALLSAIGDGLRAASPP